MKHVEKWLLDNEEAVKDIRQNSRKLMRASLSPSEKLLFSFIEACMEDIKEMKQRKELEEASANTYYHPEYIHIGQHSGGMNNNITSTVKNVDDLLPKIKQLEIRAARGKERKTPISAVPIGLPIMNSDILIHNVNISDDEIPYVKFGDNLTIKKLILSDGCYVIVDDFHIEKDSYDRNIGRINFDINRVIAKRDGTGIHHFSDTLTGLVDYQNCKITLASMTGQTVSVVFDGSLLVEKY